MRRKKKKGKKKSGYSYYLTATLNTDSNLEVSQILEEPLDYWNEKFGTNHRLSVHTVKKQ